MPTCLGPVFFFANIPPFVHPVMPPCLLASSTPAFVFSCRHAFSTGPSPRVLSALRFGLGASPNTMVDWIGSDGLTPLTLAAICGEPPTGTPTDVVILAEQVDLSADQRLDWFRFDETWVNFVFVPANASKYILYIILYIYHGAEKQKACESEMGEATDRPLMHTS